MSITRLYQRLLTKGLLVGVLVFVILAITSSTKAKTALAIGPSCDPSTHQDCTWINPFTCCPGYGCNTYDDPPKCVQGYTPPNALDMISNFLVNDILKVVYRILLSVGIIVGFFIIAKSGYELMTSQGDPQRTKTARENLTSAIIGLLFVLLAVSILRVLTQAIVTGNTVTF